MTRGFSVVIVLPALLATALTVACSGGGSSNSSPATAPPSGLATSTATFALTIPSPILSSGAQSVVITFVPVGETVPSPLPPPLIINVAPGSPDCRLVGGQTVCSGSLAVPTGQQNFTLSVYSQPGGQGTQLTVKSFVDTITSANQRFDVSNAAGAVGVLASLELVLTPATITFGVPSTVIVSVVPKDSSGNTLAGALTQPVSISAPPTPPPPAAAIFLMPSPLPAPGNLDANGNALILNPAQQYAYAYTGTRSNLAPLIAFGASAANIPPVTAYLTLVGVPTPQPSPTALPSPTLPPSPTPIPVPTAGGIAVGPNVLLFAPNAAAQTFAANATGVTMFGALSSDVTIASVTTSGGTFTVTPHNPGSAVITVTDAAGGTGTVFVYVSQVVLSIQSRGRHT